MILGIVIPLKAKRVSKNWDLTCSNLKATLSSISAQTNRSFHCTVVGHDEPDFLENRRFRDCVSFTHVNNLPPPTIGTVELENQLLYEADRCVKILTGMTELKIRRPGINYWYALDADDLIRDDFVETLQAHDGADAIIMDQGYSFYANTRIHNHENDLSRYCGSTAVLSDRLCQIDPSISTLNYRSLPFGNISHVHMRDELAKQGYTVEVPEQRLVMYVRDHGENISNLAYYNTKWLKLKKSIKMIAGAIRVKEKVRGFGTDF